MNYVALGNPIWSGQVHILGGVRRLLATATIYGGLIMVSSLLWIRASGGPLAGAVREILQFLAVAQIGILVLGGLGAMHRALQRDHTTRMIDTLRLAPIRGTTAVLGYVFGAPAQILVLFGVGVICGAALGQWSGGLKVTAWLGGNLALLLFGASLWSAAAFFGLGPGKPANLVALVIVISLTTTIWMRFLPGLGLFTGAYGVIASYHVMLDLIGTPPGFALELALAGMLTAFWSLAAARRYRKPWLSSLDPLAALFMVAMASACCIAALIVYERLLPTGWQGWLERAGLLEATLLAPLLFIHLPAAMSLHGHRRLALGARPESVRETWPPTTWALFSTVVVILGALAFLYAMAPSVVVSGTLIYAKKSAWAAVACAYLSAALLACAVRKWATYRGIKPGWATTATLIFWAVPPLLDFTRTLALQSAVVWEQVSLGVLFTCSPAGTLLAVCFDLDEALPLAPGLIIQFALIGVSFALAWRAEQSFKKKRAALLAT